MWTLQGHLLCPATWGVHIEELGTPLLALAGAVEGVGAAGWSQADCRLRGQAQAGQAQALYIRALVPGAVQVAQTLVGVGWLRAHAAGSNSWLWCSPGWWRLQRPREVKLSGGPSNWSNFPVLLQRWGPQRGVGAGESGRAAGWCGWGSLPLPDCVGWQCCAHLES